MILLQILFFFFSINIYNNVSVLVLSILRLGSMGNVCYTGWPRKNATLLINNFKKTRDRMKKLCALLRIKFFSSKMTPRSLILMKAYWFYGCFSEAMSFSRFALLFQFTYWKFSIVWLPRVKCLLLLCKAKPAWIKRSFHYITMPH